MDASYKIQRGIHVHLIQFFMCPEFWVHISHVHPSILRLGLEGYFYALECPRFAANQKQRV